MTVLGDRFDVLATRLVNTLTSLTGERVRERQIAILAVELERLAQVEHEKGYARGYASGEANE